jgi:hypothetical protein
MTRQIPDGYAELWLAEMGAHVPEHGLAPRVPLYGLGLPAHERARLHGERLEREPSAARAHRARTDQSRRA